ncbi:uncharacterized protein LOC125190519 [Salvia hispanica]|uniref:uncharacterized protein LOC125190519 n=1 Tax=Salvia hispanica TaxID=49212 RepID=UPI0020099DE3|nr:uncharacterized protein LOC125190519 [Salvia hispanica]
MVQPYHALMRRRYAKNRNFPVERYRELEWDGKQFLLNFVTDFYSHWLDAYAYGTTHHEGIMRLIHILPSPWSEWTAQASVSYTWFSPPKYTPQGDFVGLIGVLLPAMSAAVDGPPLHPPMQKYSPGAARRMKYRDDEETHVARVPQRRTFRMRISAPRRIIREAKEMLTSIPSPLSDEKEDEEMGPFERAESSNTESVGESEEPEEDEGRDV